MLKDTFSNNFSNRLIAFGRARNIDNLELSFNSKFPTPREWLKWLRKKYTDSRINSPLKPGRLAGALQSDA